MRTLLFSLCLLVSVGLVSLAGCDGSGAPIPEDGFDIAEPAVAFFQTTAGVEPRLVEGNISGEAAAVCSNPLVVGDGNAYEGIKVEPPIRGATTYGDITVQIDTHTGMLLGFIAGADTEIRHVVMKGGPDTHIYDYDGSISEDYHLHAPPNGAGRCPELSYFTICYTQ